MEILKEINEQYENIIQLNEPQRTLKLSNLMDKLSAEYKITCYEE